MSRHVLLHYHLFKNAGTSIDRMLRESYGSAWSSYDKDSPGDRISSREMQAHIEQNPHLKAISSHQVVPPLPSGEFKVFPIVFIRDPIDRVKSAWLFEWQKQLGLDKPKGSLSDYIIERLGRSSGSIIANFQIHRLSNISYQNSSAKYGLHGADHLLRAMSFLRSIQYFGIVERYGESIALMARQTANDFPDLNCTEYEENVLQDHSLSGREKHEIFEREVGSELFSEVLDRNRLDLQLYFYAQGLFDSRLEAAGIANYPEVTPDESLVDDAVNFNQSVVSI